MKKIEKTMIVVHASDTPPSMDIGSKDIKRWHVNDNGWADIGYNWVIKRNGTIEKGRDIDGDGDVNEEIGAHARGFNSKSIGICMIGGRKEGHTRQQESNFTLNQYLSLDMLVNRIKSEIKTIEEVVGHCDLPNTNKPCPCFNVKALLGS